MMIGLTVWIVGILAVLIVIGIAGWLFWQGRNFKLSETPSEQKPESMHTTPLTENSETLKTNQKELPSSGKPVALFDEDKNEKLAAPFAEQIEDMVHASLKADPLLQSISIDFGTASDGSLEFNINNTRYASIDAIPDERIRVIIKQAIEEYNQRK